MERYDHQQRETTMTANVDDDLAVAGREIANAVRVPR